MPATCETAQWQGKSKHFALALQNTFPILSSRLPEKFQVPNVYNHSILPTCKCEMAQWRMVQWRMVQNLMELVLGRQRPTPSSWVGFMSTAPQILETEE